MRKLFFSAVLLVTLLLMAAGAVAEPVITHNGYTAYLGEDNYLFLEDPNRATMVLRLPISEIVAFSDTHVYCIAQDGRLLGIRIDGTQSLILSTRPTQEDIDRVKTTPVYELNGNVLSVTNANGTKRTISAIAVAACTNDDTLFYIESGVGGVTTLKSYQLNTYGAAAVSLGQGVTSPVSMLATDETLTIVAADRSVTVIQLIDRSRSTFPAISTQTVKAASISGTLFRYTLDEKGYYLVEEEPEDELFFVMVPDSGGSATSTERPVVTQRPTVRPTATPRPTQRPTTRPVTTQRPTASDSEYERIDKGDRGSNVRKMQERLSVLGYPVGSVDGVWGDDTQLAVNLFQCAIGYRERSYASPEMLEKLYSRSAPNYDPYAPLREGDEGTDVLLMQTTLQLMGYNPGKLDGIYGKNTVAAIMLFQSVIKIEVTGQASKETLAWLYSPICPMNPSYEPDSGIATSTDLR